MSTIANSTAPIPVEPAAEPMSIAKPTTSGLNAFRSKRASGIGGVETLPSALPHHRILGLQRLGDVASG